MLAASESSKKTAKEESKEHAHEGNPELRLTKKLERMQVQATVDWHNSRAFTPNSIVFLHGRNGGRLLKSIDDPHTTVDLYAAGQQSQGLVRVGDRTVGGAVTSSIHTTTDRKQETKSTFIQYDKGRVDIKDKDFTVCAKNYRGSVNYQGGHIIDHKYSAAGSHFVEANYVPMHYFYNSPIKEYLVQRSDDYIEIVLYTSNPPTIGVKGKNKSHEIPVGIIFVQLKDKKIKDAYFFPNNAYSYHALKAEFGITKNLAETITPCFRLKRAFHELLLPACAVDVVQDEKRVAEQEQHEATRVVTVDDIAHGMELAECSDEEQVVSKVAFDVVHNGSVDVEDFLDLDEKAMEVIQQDALQIAFDELGKFLVNYALKNALKSEFVSIRSRIIFLNVVVDFIEAYTEVEGEALEFVETTMGADFKQSLNELYNIRNNMTVAELLLLANLYQRLAEYGNQAFGTESYDALYDIEDVYRYVGAYFNILKVVNEKVDERSLTASTLFNLVELFSNAQVALSFIYRSNDPMEDFDEGRKFLAQMKPRVKHWLGLYSQDKPSAGISESYENGIHRVSYTRTSLGFIATGVECLGSKGSMFFPNDDVSDSELDDEEDDDTAEQSSEESKDENSSATATATSPWPKAPAAQPASVGNIYAAFLAEGNSMPPREHPVQPQVVTQQLNASQVVQPSSNRLTQ